MDMFVACMYVLPTQPNKQCQVCHL